MSQTIEAKAWEITTRRDKLLERLAEIPRDDFETGWEDAERFVRDILDLCKDATRARSEAILAGGDASPIPSDLDIADTVLGAMISQTFGLDENEYAHALIAMRLDDIIANYGGLEELLSEIMFALRLQDVFSTQRRKPRKRTPAK